MILLGEIDLSVGSIIAVAGMVGAQCFAFGMGFVPAIALTLAAGALMGMLNGVLTAKLLLPSFIVTVATMGIYRGMVSLPTNGAPAMIENENLDGNRHREIFLGCRSSSGVVAVLFVINQIVLSKTSFGRRAISDRRQPRGGRLTPASRSDRLKILIFMISGVMAAISGILLSSRLFSAQTNAGMSYELDAIAAAVLAAPALPAASEPWSAR